MIEHLDKEEAICFLREAYRVLKPGGIIRVVVPDISKIIGRYNEKADADKFVEDTHMSSPRPKGISQRIKFLIVGTRHHQWMYDGQSLCTLLNLTGFCMPTIMKAGETLIKDHEPLNLYERKSESLYVEAVKNV